MSFVPNQFTVRERALVAMESLFKTPSWTSENYGFAWDQVLRSPLSGWAFKKKRSIGLFDGHEVTREQLMVKDCMLRVALEMKIVLQPNDLPSTVMNEVFGAVQRCIQVDPSLGGLVIDLQEESNDAEIEDANQKEITGVMFLNMHYRHSVRDPRALA